MRRQPVLAIVFLLAAAPCVAQTATRPFCWRSPERGCEVILLTEVSYQRVLATNERRIAFDDGTVTSERSRGLGSQLSWEVGLLKSLDDQTALGLTYEIGVAFESIRHGLRARGRRFVGPESSVEAGVGVVRGPVGSFVTTDAVGLSLDARYNVQDKLTVMIAYDNFDWPDLQTPGFSYVDDADRAHALKVGVASGSWTALISSGALAVAYALLLLAYASGT